MAAKSINRSNRATRATAAEDGILGVAPEEQRADAAISRLLDLHVYGDLVT